MIRVGTLFSGVGAPEMALRLEGIEHEVVFAAEIDKYARRTYEANFGVPSDAWYKDVRDVRDADPVDLLVGGPPCQAFSVAGTRRGLDDPRGKMLFEFIRILEELQPRTFIFENVPGLLSMDKGGVWRLLMDLFKDTGYAVHSRYLNAKHYGVPQNRRRIFAVGFRTDGMMAFTFPDRVPLEIHMGDLLEDVVPGRYKLSEKGKAYVLAERPDYNGAGGGIDLEIAHAVNSTLGKHHRSGVDNYYSGKLVDEKFVLAEKSTRLAGRLRTAVNPQVSPTITAEGSRHVSYNGTTVVTDPRGTPLELVDEKYVLNPGPTKTAVSKQDGWGSEAELNRDVACSQLAGQFTREVRGGLVNYVSDPRKMGIRRLTPRECFRLQGFPDSFKIPVSDAQAYRQAGNSMCVAVVRGVLRSVMAAVV